MTELEAKKKLIEITEAADALAKAARTFLDEPSTWNSDYLKAALAKIIGICAVPSSETIHSVAIEIREAAEEVIEGLSCGSREDLQNELSAWRKAAGKK